MAKIPINFEEEDLDFLKIVLDMFSNYDDNHVFTSDARYKRILEHMDTRECAKCKKIRKCSKYKYEWACDECRNRR